MFRSRPASCFMKPSGSAAHLPRPETSIVVFNIFKKEYRIYLYSGMTITQLEYVAAVDEYRHFATAAEKCFVSQPTLSMQLQKLEEELGEKLFDRSKQPVIPTDAGRKVIGQIRNALREFRKIPEIVREYQGEVSGELRLGIIPTVAPYLL